MTHVSQKNRGGDSFYENCLTKREFLKFPGQLSVNFALPASLVLLKHQGHKPRKRPHPDKTLSLL